MEEDIQKCCRICLDVDSEHVAILGDPTLHLQLKSCLALCISHSDDLPKTICNACVTQLGKFYDFQLNARCSQDWLETSLEQKTKKSCETKTPIQPLPDSEYNSDSLLEFLNNTANIEDYLNNLGKEDIPSIVNLLDRNESSIACQTKPAKAPTPKKKENITVSKSMKSSEIQMEIDVLDSDVAVVIMKETEPKVKIKNTDKNLMLCFACDAKFDNVSKLSQHMSVCDEASRTCIHCNILLDSKHKMQQHYLTHNTLPPFSCNCGKQFPSKEKLSQHHRTCLVDYGAAIGCVYSCKQCGETFKERLQLFRHAKQHVLKAEQRMCDICGHSFTGSEALAKHKLDVHNKTDNLTYRCKVCDMTSSNRNEMYMHVQKHTSAQPEPSRHLCDSCGRSFATSSSLSRHLVQHGKSHQCDICFKYFNEQKLLEQHKVEHKTLIMCERCGQTIHSYKIAAHTCL